MERKTVMKGRKERPQTNKRNQEENKFEAISYVCN